ncbi:hypothetical protein PsorP6_008828 [Peronosclerospora sorghi]|uniref:Uncharacterized protein n=1 Tax=Peronosclerospora sorghi TaxID=230839 RepID=A0ACC0W003_9STRA|nr:hypothetical protein PsorP6_008828 [Peronosclerospora sorghi]
MVDSNFKGQAAAWFTFNQDQFTTFSQLDDALQAEFIPSGFQKRLRPELFRLKKANCNGLEDNVPSFALSSVKCKICQRLIKLLGLLGLVTQVSYRRCATVSNVISSAFEFERSHTQPRLSGRDDRGMNSAERMEVDNVHMRHPSREGCRGKNLCFRCKNPGHRMNDCHVKIFRGRRKDDPRPVVHSVQIRKPSLVASKNDELMYSRSYTMNMSQWNKKNCLIRKKVFVNGRERIALIDWVENQNRICPGIVDDPGIEDVASVESFEGHIRLKMRCVQSTPRLIWMA